MNREEASATLRKTRSDKKRDVKPTIPLELKECVYRLSYIMNTPVKDIAESLCVEGIFSKRVLEYMSSNFKRSIRLEGTLYVGDINRRTMQKRHNAGKSERITIRFKPNDYENITALAYALDVTPSRATALLLDASVRNAEFINEFVRLYLKENLDSKRMKEMRGVMKFINTNNPYEEEISWSSTLSYIMGEFKSEASNIKEKVNEFLIKHGK